jgi:hypothetical protein
MGEMPTRRSYVKGGWQKFERFGVRGVRGWSTFRQKRGAFDVVLALSQAMRSISISGMPRPEHCESLLWIKSLAGSQRGGRTTLQMGSAEPIAEKVENRSVMEWRTKCATEKLSTSQAFGAISGPMEGIGLHNPEILRRQNGLGMTRKCIFPLTVGPGRTRIGGGREAGAASSAPTRSTAITLPALSVHGA